MASGSRKGRVDSRTGHLKNSQSCLFVQGVRRAATQHLSGFRFAPDSHMVQKKAGLTVF
jgi:hypothetical protein